MTTSAPDRQTTKLNGPDELLHAIPYLLGFHPTESLVVVGLRRRIVVMTARLDLSEARKPGAVEHTIRAVESGGAAEILAVVYSSGCRRQRTRLPHREIISEVLDEAEAVGVEVLDALLVEDDRWWSYTCAAPDCCPPQGRRVDAADSAFAAEATYAGMVALPDRAALEQSLQPEHERARLAPITENEEQDAVREVLAGRTDRRQRAVKRAIFAAARRLDSVGEDGEAAGLSDAEVVRYTVALREIAVRDAVWMAVDGRRIEGCALWRELARRAPEPYDAAPLFLYGWSSWRAGNGALARIAAERAISSDPGYSAADLLLAALAKAIDPRGFPKLRGSRGR